MVAGDHVCFCSDRSMLSQQRPQSLMWWPRRRWSFGAAAAAVIGRVITIIVCWLVGINDLQRLFPIQTLLD